jgi:thiamine-phosphate pyrophosphorylase
MKAYIKAIPVKYHKRIVIHSNHKLAIHYHLKGIHLTEKYRKSPLKFLYSYFYIYKTIQSKMTISTSYHDVMKIIKANYKYSYVFLSPVFKSISKEEYKPVMTLPKLQDRLRETKSKVFALGGVDECNLNICQNVGFVGVGLLGAIWKNDEPVEKFYRIHDQCTHNLMPH